MSKRGLVGNFWFSGTFCQANFVGLSIFVQQILGFGFGIMENCEEEEGQVCGPKRTICVLLKDSVLYHS